MKIHLIFPYAATYRQSIYQLLSDQLDCVFHFCNNTNTSLKQMDYKVLKNCNFDLTEKVVKGNWKTFRGLDKIKFTKGDVIIVPGNIRYISLWTFMIKNHLLVKGLRVIPWTHGGYGRESNLQYFIKKLFYGLSNHILLYGEHGKRILLNHGIATAEKMTIVWNSLDYDRQIQYRSMDCPDVISKHFNNNNKTILFIGRLTYEKKLDDLVKAIHLLKERGELYNCIFIGNGEAKEIIQSSINKYDLQDRIWLYGPCFNDSEMYPLLKHADICVSPGNVGLTAIHVMMYGMPVITHGNFAYQGPEFEAIREGETGSFFKQNDLNSLVDCISKWFSKATDRNSIRRNCYQVIDNYYNPHKQLKILKDVIYGG